MFLEDVQAGLSQQDKKLSSKYFYDKTGDRLFVEIMNMPEYYLTNAEHEILLNQSTQLIETFGVSKEQPFELIELGAAGESFTFEKGERIYTEISGKYNDYVLGEIVKGTQFMITDKLTDSRAYFANYVLQRT